mmetsp:Transcript_6336/g.18283  ORF Transcript_6336/g.18283 Transcript_6336/m.18283 type:complete len:84 (+) Transcript_6336:37-288(+)
MHADEGSRPCSRPLKLTGLSDELVGFFWRDRTGRQENHLQAPKLNGGTTDPKIAARGGPPKGDVVRKSKGARGGKPSIEQGVK